MSASAPIQNMDLSFAISDIYYSNSGGLFRPDWEYLVQEILNIERSPNLDQNYRDNVAQSLHSYFLRNLKEAEFKKIFSSHAEDLELKERMIQTSLPILCEALLQRNFKNRYYHSAFKDLMAFQAIINTIFTQAIKTGASAPPPPLVTWGRKHKGPFTIPADIILKTFDINCGVVCMPPEFRNGGLFAWSVMGHEVAGHNFIRAKQDLLEELKDAVGKGLKTKLEARLKKDRIQYSSQMLADLCAYWSMKQRVEEIASDIFGIFNTGPSLAIGCIGYFRGMSPDSLMKMAGSFEAKKQPPTLHLKGGSIDREVKDLSGKVKIEEQKGRFGLVSGQELQYTLYEFPSDPHPVAALRLITMIEAIRKTNLSNADNWAGLIEDELRSKEFSRAKSVKLIKMNMGSTPPKDESIEIPLEIACISAEIVGNIICTTKFKSLDHKQIGSVFNWSNRDETLVDQTRQTFRTKDGSLPSAASASHIVAAAVLEASTKGADIESLFQMMKGYLYEAKRQT